VTTEYKSLNIRIIPLGKGELNMNNRELMEQTIKYYTGPNRIVPGKSIKVSESLVYSPNEYVLGGVVLDELGNIYVVAKDCRRIQEGRAVGYWTRVFWLGPSAIKNITRPDGVLKRLNDSGFYGGMDPIIYLDSKEVTGKERERIIGIFEEAFPHTREYDEDVFLRNMFDRVVGDNFRRNREDKA